jgi:hypothetical protein
MTTRRTTAVLDKLRDTVAAEFERSIQDQIANAKDAKEAQTLLISGKSMGFKGTATFQGREVKLTLSRTFPTVKKQDFQGRPVDRAAPGFEGRPDDWEVSNALKYSYLHANEYTHARKSGERNLTLDLRKDDQWIFTGFDGKALTNVKRAKLELWFAQNAASTAHRGSSGSTILPKCVFVDKLSADEKFWTKGWEVHDWADVQAIELPTNGTGGTRLRGSYDIVLCGAPTGEVPAAKIQEHAKTMSLYWTRGNMWTGARHRLFKADILDLKNSVVVCLPSNRIAKFCRDFPQAKDLETAAKEAAERWVQKQSALTRKAYSVQHNVNIETLKNLDASELKDPDLVDLHKLATMSTTKYQSDRAVYSYWVQEPEIDTAWADKILARYPLYNDLPHYGGCDKKHVTLYLNAVYEARQKGGI